MPEPAIRTSHVVSLVRVSGVFRSPDGGSLDCGRLKPKPDRLRRSPGVPYVSVTDLEVQQVFQAHDLAESSAPELMVAECLS